MSMKVSSTESASSSSPLPSTLSKSPSSSLLIDHPKGKKRSKEEILQNTNDLIRKHELIEKEKEISNLHNIIKYKIRVYSVSFLSEKVIGMESGVHTKQIFDIIVNCVARFRGNINYYNGWQVQEDLVRLEDQIFITLMKLRQNYPNFHIAQLYGISESTVSNIIHTFIHVLHKLLFENIMKSNCPSKNKNRIVAPTSFLKFPNCRMVIDCTDFKIAIPKQMDKQRATYSSYRSINSFKALIGVSPHGVINFVSKLYPGSVSDKAIVQHCGLLDILSPGDLILADKGFLIQDILPEGVTVNVPPFLYTKFTEQEILLTKEIASCRIHVERANERLKNFNILSFIPPMLRERADTIFQLVAALVNLQFPLIKETSFH